MSQERAIVPIRYDGLDAERHQIELLLLGESLEGVARILGVTGHFLATGTYAKQIQALDVRVYVAEPKANCFSLSAVIEFTKQQQLLAGVAGVVLGPLIGWIIARASNNKAEMKALKDSLDKAVHHLAQQNTELVPRLLRTVEKMADSLRPSVRAAVAPVGKSCAQMSLGHDAVIDEATAQAIRAVGADEVTEERSWTVRITELDWETASAKIRFEDDGAEEGRFRAVITDPAIGVCDNAYVKALAAQTPIKVRGKATLREGEIQVLYVSNTESRPG
jgi:uncharacterized membrane-anchored protein YhcB (DUF1043 family)